MVALYPQQRPARSRTRLCSVADLVSSAGKGGSLSRNRPTEKSRKTKFRVDKILVIHFPWAQKLVRHFEPISVQE